MIKKLRLQFVIVTMGVLLVMFFVMFMTLNIFMRNSSIRQTDQLLEFIAAHDGKPASGSERMPDLITGSRPRPGIQEARGGRFFYAKTDREGGILDLNLDMMFDVTREEALENLSIATSQNKERGTIGDFRYLVSEKEYGKLIVFAEMNTARGMLAQLISVSLWSAAVSILILLALALLLSKWVTNPVQRAFSRQKQFISDASHELKTPLTILSANADVLEAEIGANTWLSRIKAQSERMHTLIEDLLVLARADEGDSQVQFAEFDLSKAVLSATLEFESRTFEEGKRFSYDIENGIRYTGNESGIKQVVSILIDNAIKHSNASGEIGVRLKMENGRILFSVYNTGIGVQHGERDKIFERFYRSDASRSRETGGYGLGLSIAKSLVDSHKGRITVDGEYGRWVIFSVLL